MMPLNFSFGVKVSSLLLGCIILFLYYRRSAESTEPLASSSLIFGNEDLALTADLCETIAPNPVKSATKFAFAPPSPTPPPPPPSLSTDSEPPSKPPPTPPFTDYPLPWLSFAQERQCTLDPYFYQQIDFDLAPFRRLRNETFQKPISKQMIEEASRLNSITRQTHLIITFHQDGNVEFNREDDMFLSHTFGFCRGVAPYLPEGLKIIINQDDSPFILRNNKPLDSSFRGNHRKKKSMNGPETAPPTRSLLPFFSYCKTKEYNDILIPSFQQYFWGCVVPKDQLIPFESIEKNNNTIFWRGCTTGTEIRQDNYYKQSQRFLAVEWGMNISKEKEKKNSNNSTTYPYETDIAFHEICHCKDENICEEVKKVYKFGNIVDCSEHQRYRYLLVVDGNTWVQRFMQFLHFESLLFYHPHFIEWYSTFIRPDEHYIWIQDDYSDLDEKLRWAMENPGEVSEMVKRTSLFAQRHLRLVDLECYWFLLLLRYAELVEQ